MYTVWHIFVFFFCSLLRRWFCSCLVIKESQWLVETQLEDSLLQIRLGHFLTSSYCLWLGKVSRTSKVKKLVCSSYIGVDFFNWGEARCDIGETFYRFRWGFRSNRLKATRPVKRNCENWTSLVSLKVTLGKKLFICVIVWLQKVERNVKNSFRNHKLKELLWCISR